MYVSVRVCVDRRGKTTSTSWVYFSGDIALLEEATSLRLKSARSIVQMSLRNPMGQYVVNQMCVVSNEIQLCMNSSMSLIPPYPRCHICAH
jgi:hypothetical protein